MGRHTHHRIYGAHPKMDYEIGAIGVGLGPPIYLRDLVNDF